MAEDHDNMYKSRSRTSCDFNVTLALMAVGGLVLLHYFGCQVNYKLVVIKDYESAFDAV